MVQKAREGESSTLVESEFPAVLTPSGPREPATGLTHFVIHEGHHSSHPSRRSVKMGSFAASPVAGRRRRPCPGNCRLLCRLRSRATRRERNWQTTIFTYDSTFRAESGH